jgi:membrane-bound metal-dependent hydrolase YbcI (DUF457 family)
MMDETHTVLAVGAGAVISLSTPKRARLKEYIIINILMNISAILIISLIERKK